MACAAYAGLHISLYVLDQHFDLLKVASEIVLRVYLLIGALALAGLIALAATSTDAAIAGLARGAGTCSIASSMGSPLLAAVHFFMQSKLNIYEPVLMAGFLLWLLAFRVLFWRNGAVAPLHLLLLAGAVAMATAAAEATIYMLTSGVDARRVLLAHSISTWKCGRPGGSWRPVSPSRQPEPGVTGPCARGRGRGGWCQISRQLSCRAQPKCNRAVDVPGGDTDLKPVLAGT